MNTREGKGREGDPPLKKEKCETIHQQECVCAGLSAVFSVLSLVFSFLSLFFFFP